MHTSLEGIVTWAEIDLEAISFNVKAFRRFVTDRVEIIAVVKANAYGHGAIQVGRAALQAGARRLAVHRAIEGIELRHAGIQAPILIMGYTPPDGAEKICRWGLTPSLMTPAFAHALSAQAGALGVTVPVHVKVDTGMSRFGLLPNEVLDFLHFLQGLPGISIEGFFTHFATADSADQTHLRLQLKVFNEVIAAVQNAGFNFPLIHAANSAATMQLPEAHFNAVRPGIALYGLEPSNEWPPIFEIHPALTLKSRISRVREVPAGSGVSYGRTYVTGTPTRLALVPVGYGDGYHRLLSNKASVLVHGHKAPIRGRVCMDQFVIDIDHIPNVQMDDEVVLVGEQENQRIRAEEIAALAGTINYEVTTSILPRVARVYRRGEQIIDIDALGTREIPIQGT